MTESAVAFGTPLVSSGARLKGNARGAMVCALFGSAWMFWTAAFVPAAKSASLAFVSIVTLLICGWALLRVRVARRYEDSAADRARWAAIAPLFWIDTAAEWVLGGGSVFALAHFGRYSLIPQFLGVTIGLHFLPLAKLLRAPRYYIMGTAMVLCVLASHSRGQYSQCLSVRRDWSPHVDYSGGDLIPRLSDLNSLKKGYESW